MGCSSKKIKPDVVSFDHTYNAAEIVINDKRNLGLMIHKVEPNKLFVFSVKGYHNGKIRVDSKSCDMAEVQSYKDFEEVLFVAHVGDRRCVIAISVIPEFTAQESNGVPWRQFTGILVLWVDTKKVVEYTDQFRRGDDVKFKFQIFENTYYDFIGCGVDDSGFFPVGITEKTFKVDKSRKFCLIDGVLQSNSSTSSHLLLYGLTDGEFTPLAFPSITFVDGGINIRADPNTSIMEFGGKVIFGNEGKFKYDETPGYLRIITSGGRAILCRIWERKHSCQR